MDRQTNMTHPDVLLIQSALHHDPSQSALQSSQQEEDDHRDHHLPGDHAFPQKPEEWKKKDQTYQTGPLTMEPLPEIDELEIRQRKIKVDVLELPDLLIFFKGSLPVRLIHGRQCTQDRLPFGDGQSRTRQAGDAAEEDLDHDHPDTRKQPDGDGPGSAGGTQFRFHDAKVSTPLELIPNLCIF